ncbi:aldo/keto reductase [Nonomuraea wenchangensis]|uniref:aldo/keto reductase n=1 Tax=Nonomuraea wenchangensis TaxID=568860 RepID=UPI00331CF86D
MRRIQAFRPQREFHGDKRFAGPGFSEAELEIARAAERLARDWGLMPYQASLAWLLFRPGVASAIVGAETVEEITANASAADTTLEQAQIEALTALHGDCTASKLIT